MQCNLTPAIIMWVAVPEQYTYFSVAAVRYFLSSPVLVTIWGDFGILECPHGPFRRNAARRFPVCTSAGNHLGRFWNIGMSARTFQEKCSVLFPVYTSTGNYLGRFWNIGMSARTFQEKCSVLFPVCTSAGNYLGRFWNIGISARTFQEKTEGRTVRLQCLAGALQQSPCLVNTGL